MIFCLSVCWYELMGKGGRRHLLRFLDGYGNTAVDLERARSRAVM